MAAQTGLTQLGDALLRGTGDYANIALRRRQEEERRAQQLADLQSERLYAEGQTIKGTERQKDLYQWQARQARIQALKAKGLLSDADAMDEVKIAAADALDTKESARLGEQKRTRDKDAQAYVNTLGKQANDIQDEIAETVKELNRIPKTVTPPTLREVDALAKQLAGKEDYKNAEVRQRFQQAAQAQLLNDRRAEFILAQQAGDGLRDSLTGSRYRMDSITRQLTDMAKQDYFPAGAPPMAPAGVLAPPTQTPELQEASEEERAAAAGFQPSVAQPPAASPAAIIEDPSLAPSASIKGQLQRLPMPSINPIGPGISADPLAINTSAALRGIWDGDFGQPLPGDYMSEAKAKAAKLRRSLDQPLPALNPLPRQAPAGVFSNPYMPRLGF